MIYLVHVHEKRKILSVFVLSHIFILLSPDVCHYIHKNKSLLLNRNMHSYTKDTYITLYFNMLNTGKSMYMAV